MTTFAFRRRRVGFVLLLEPGQDCNISNEAQLMGHDHFEILDGFPSSALLLSAISRHQSAPEMTMSTGWRPRPLLADRTSAYPGLRTPASVRLWRIVTPALAVGAREACPPTEPGGSLRARGHTEEELMPGSDRGLTFGGSPSITIPACAGGECLISMSRPQRACRR